MEKSKRVKIAKRTVLTILTLLSRLNSVLFRLQRLGKRIKWRYDKTNRPQLYLPGNPLYTQDKLSHHLPLDYR